jgi:hypothetical protein
MHKIINIKAIKLITSLIIANTLFLQSSYAQQCDLSDADSLSKRSTAEVFMDHLHQRYLGNIECDLKRNYSKDVVMVENYGIFHGFDGVRESARILNKLVPTSKYKMDNLVFNKDNAFEAWSVDADGVKVTDGIDAFIIRDGKIQVQTIYYTSNSKLSASLQK